MKNSSLHLAGLSLSLCLTPAVAFTPAETTREIREPREQTEPRTKSTPRTLAPRARLVVTGATPVSVGTIALDPRQTRQPLPASDGADYLLSVPGFSSVRNGGTNADPVLRGMTGSRLNILSNGTTIQGVCPGRMDPATSYMSPETFDNITIIKGPQTVLWGPIGSAGTVLFERDTRVFTERGVRFHGGISVASAARQERLFDVAVGNPRADARLIMQGARSGDYRDGAGKQVHSRWDKWNVDSTIGWNIGTHTRLALDAGLGDGAARYAGRDMDGTSFKRQSVALRFKQTDIHPLIASTDGRLFFNRTDHTMDNYGLRALGAKGKRMASNVDRSVIGGRAAVTLRLNTDLALDIGVDGQSQRRRWRSPIMKGPQHEWGVRSERTQFGGFGELAWQLSDQDRLILGARADAIAVTDRRPDAPVMAAKANASKQTTKQPAKQRHALLPSGFLRLEHDFTGTGFSAYAGVGHARRFPDDWELFFASGGPDPYGNAFAGLQPEKTTQLDFGAKYKTDRHEAWFSAYAGRVSDFILMNYGSLAGPGVSSRARNIAATVAGGEMGGMLAIGTHWVAEASFAYAWGNNRTDSKPLAQLPPAELRLAASYTHGRSAVGALLRVAAPQKRVALQQGNIGGRDLATSSGFGVLSINGSHALNKRLNISVGLDNVLNKRYAEHLNRAGSAAFAYAPNTPFNNPGRTAWAKVIFDL